jgi:hypothetical protein
MSNNDDNVPTTPEGLRRAYDAAKTSGLSEKTRADSLAKENMFLRAGINPETTAGKLLFNGYHGDSLDELKAMAIEIGALKAPDPQPAADGQPAATQATPAERTFTTEQGLPPDWEQRAEMQSLARSGQPHGGQDNPTPHPMDASMTQFWADMGEGMEPEEARVKAMSAYMMAASKGDKRTRFDAEAHRAKALEAER